MTDFTLADLLGFAYRRERVTAQRLARQQGMALLPALEVVLQRSAGAGSLQTLQAARLEESAASSARQAGRRQTSRLRFESRKAGPARDPSDWQAWFDGSALPNPGRLGLGAVLRAPDGTVLTISRAAGDGDGNRAEYLALIAVLESALAAKVRDLVIYGDSRIVIDDVLGTVPVRTAGLLAQRDHARALLGRFRRISLAWIPRARNSAADALARQALACGSTTASALTRLATERIDQD